MKENMEFIRTCPKCGKVYTGHPAMSREDNKTPICPDCGSREALTALGISSESQEHILEIMHRTMKS